MTYDEIQTAIQTAMGARPFGISGIFSSKSGPGVVRHKTAIPGLVDKSKISHRIAVSLIQYRFLLQYSGPNWRNPRTTCCPTLTCTPRDRLPLPQSPTRWVWREDDARGGNQQWRRYLCLDG